MNSHRCLIAFIAVVVLCAATPAPSEAQLFDTWIDYDVGWRPESVATGDFDGDGNLDLATANQDSHTVSVLLGNGDGTFQDMVSYGLEDGPCDLAMDDLDDDGDQDLAVGYQETSHVSVLLNNGDGTFSAAVNYLVGDSPRSLTIGDLDNDGVSDLAVANYDSNDVSVLSGNGDGTFAPAITDEFWGEGGVGRPSSIDMGDLDGDGNQDLTVVRYTNNRLDIGLGNGDGSFRWGGSYVVVTYDNPLKVVLGKLDDNETPDVVVLYESSTLLYGANARIYIFWNYQGGSFSSWSPAQAGGNCRAVVIDDLDGNGFSDLIMANTGLNSVTVGFGLGNHDFQSPEHFGVGSEPVSIVAGDLDGDGFLDVATANSGIDTISVLINTTGTVSAELTCSPLSGTLPFSSLIQGTLTNRDQWHARRFHYNIDVTLAGGQYYSAWRLGWQNVWAGEAYTRRWSQTIPAVPSLLGLNLFELTATDVTPPPYNQPPYPPSGDTDRDICMVTGVAP